MAAKPVTKALVWALDDSPLLLEAVRRVLSSSFTVAVFGDGAELIEQLTITARKPDVLIVDWQMDGVQGIDVCHFVRETFDTTTLPIVILTSSADHENMLEGFEAGANDYIAKPFNNAELIARVRGLVRIKRLGDQLREEAAFRERFMSILGHDLRQPLGTLTIGAQVLCGANLSNERRAGIAKRLAHAAERMNRMIGDLLDVSRARLGNGLPIQLGPVSLGDVCARIIEDTRSAHPERVIELRISGDLDGNWDVERLTQLCTNLVGNSLQHGGADSPITVVLEGRADEVVIRVENGGEAIPESLLPGIFEPFRRGRDSESTGLGLGLYIVNQVARAHGGTATAESRGGVTSVEVKIPRAVATTTEPRHDTWH